MPPIIAGIPDLGMCDLLERDCVITSVLGYGFIETSNLTCSITSFEVFAVHKYQSISYKDSVIALMHDSIPLLIKLKVCVLIFFFEVFETNNTNSEVSHTVVAELETSLEVRCMLANDRRRRSADDDLTSDLIARGYKVSVSNDGVTYSDEDILVVYDSTCVNCTISGLHAICVAKVYLT